MTEENEYDKYDQEEDNVPVFSQPQDKEGWLTTPGKTKSITHPSDLLNKELRLSFLDDDLYYIFSMRSSAIDDWRNIGMHRLALRRKIALDAKLGLRASVDGNERILQNNPAVTGRMDLGQVDMPQVMQGQEEQEQKGGGLFGKLRRK